MEIKPPIDPMTLKEQIQISVPNIPAVALTATLNRERRLTYVDPDQATWDFYKDADGQIIPGRGKKYEVVVWKPDLKPGETISSEAVREHFRALHAFGHTGAFTQWLRTVADPSGYHATIPEDNACWRYPYGGLCAPYSIFDGDNRKLNQNWLDNEWNDNWSFVAVRKKPSDSGTLGTSSDSWRLCSDCWEKISKHKPL